MPRALVGGAREILRWQSSESLGGISLLPCGSAAKWDNSSVSGAVPSHDGLSPVSPRREYAVGFELDIAGVLYSVMDREAEWSRSEGRLGQLVFPP